MNKKPNRAPTSLHHHPVLDFCRREIGDLPSRNFSHRFAASKNLVLHLQLYRKLQKHSGCVNTVSFNGDGTILISGSDDRRVILWNWEIGSIKLSFKSGHSNNVFQAKFMPFSDDRNIVTCAADGEVRHSKILESGKVETSLLGFHQGRAHRLAIEPGSPHVFYTCGEDGLIQHFDLRTGAATELFMCQSMGSRRNFIGTAQLNAITMDPRNPNLFAVAGMDEYARLYDIRRCRRNGSSNFGRVINYFCPPHLIGNDHVGITGLDFSAQSELLLSYNSDFIYLFNPDMGLGPNPTIPSSKYNELPKEESLSPEDYYYEWPSYLLLSLRCPDHRKGLSDEDIKASVAQVYKGHKNYMTVRGVIFFGPCSEYVVSGSDCGRIFIWSKKGGELIRVMDADKHIINCVEPHPHMPVFASCGIQSDIKVWTPTAAQQASLPKSIEEDDDDDYDDDDDMVDDDNEGDDDSDNYYTEDDDDDDMDYGDYDSESADSSEDDGYAVMSNNGNGNVNGNTTRRNVSSGYDDHNDDGGDYD